VIAADIAPSFARLVRRIRDELQRAGVEGAARDARLIVAHAASLSDAGLIVRERDAVDAGIIERAEFGAQRRAAGEPVARIVGEKEFYGLVFALGPDTLVPRPETELLVEASLAHLGQCRGPRFLELGTGTGCVAIAMALHCPTATGLATDISEGALEVAADNARTYGVEGRLGFAPGDWYGAVPAGERFDLVVANPPYIASADLPGLAREVSEHDPRAALDGGADGLDGLRAVVAGAGKYLGPGGMLAVEIGASQAAPVAALAREAGFETITTRQDLAGHDRVITSRVPGREEQC
jgi:release factor glutamine methyltransferase